MIKMVELRTMILSSLKAVHPRVFFQQAPDDAMCPYIVYDLPNSTDDGSTEQVVLDIDGWDDKTDTTVLETLMDSIDKEIHRKTMTIPGQLSATFYRENRMALTDDDKRIRRRKYVYQIRTHE